MVAFNVSGSWIYLDTACDVVDFLSMDLVDDVSPLILYSPAGTWTDSSTNDRSAPVCPIHHDIFTFTR